MSKLVELIMAPFTDLEQSGDSVRRSLKSPSLGCCTTVAELEIEQNLPDVLFFKL